MTLRKSFLTILAELLLVGCRQGQPADTVEETMQALIDIVRQGKALYVGISKYPLDLQLKCYDILREAKVPCLVSQYRYSMYDRKVEDGTLKCAADNGSGVVAFSPLAQGLLTDRYLNGIPEHSRAARETGFLQKRQVSEERVAASIKLNEIAKKRGQSLAQMALAWILKDERMTSVIIGASSVEQLNNNIKCIDNLDFSAEELSQIEDILKDPVLSF
jgi:L-glyceraldehyde 3-phosphate reductase